MVEEWFPKLATAISSFLVSTKTSFGVLRPVLDPFKTRIGATLPLSVVRKTRISLVTGPVTYNSWWSASMDICDGQLSRVCDPWITRNGGVSPFAFRGYTVIDGARYSPVPGTKSRIRVS